MPDRPRYSRFRRLPGLYRIGEKKPADPHAEPQLLSLYMPGRALDRAEVLAIRAGGGSVQAYCEELLGKAIESEHARVQDEEANVRSGPMKSLDALADDPEYFAEWTASVRIRDQIPSELPLPLSAGQGQDNSVEADDIGVREVILRHAGMGDEGTHSLLLSLRRGMAIDGATADELLAALVQLETRHFASEQIDRRLAYALHRLAFEGQILLTDGFAGSAPDPASVEYLRKIQEAVDRVLSGEDIRYYAAQDSMIDPS